MEVLSWKGGDGFDMWANVKRPCASTISLEITGNNLFPTASGSTTLAFDKPGRKKIFSKRVIERSIPWNFNYTFHSQCGLVQAPPDRNYRYEIPIRESGGVLVSQGFHGTFSHFGAANEYAIDFSVPENTPVYAAREGVVVQVVQSFTRGGPDIAENDVNVVRIQHSDFSIGEYAHLRANGVIVREGQVIKRGELLAYSGNTGHTSGPHLHFAVHVPVDGIKRRSIPIAFFTGESPGEVLQQGKRYISRM